VGGWEGKEGRARENAKEKNGTFTRLNFFYKRGERKTL
jgi:hypothetical protein